MAGLVYLTCSATAVLCAVLLLRGYRRSRMRLLLWSGVCFAILFLDNVLLFLDVVVFPDISLLPWRNIPGLAAVGVLLYGLIWDRH